MRRARAARAAVAALVAITLAATALVAGGARGAGIPGTAAPPPSYAVGLRVVRLVDRSRTITLKGGRRVPRTLVTYVRYPAAGTPTQTDVPNAAPEAGPFPMIVFGHGFAVTPAIYAPLLQSWARAGFVVAAPVFPLGSADAPGGPNEDDVINQPADMSFVISSMLQLSAAGPGANPFAGLIDPASIAVAGHSDGAETALAVAYSRRYRDPRVRASVIMSGAMMSGIGGYSYPPGSPALLAVQGTADIFNEPRYTYTYFRLARRPKYLLRLLDAGHLPPYTRQQPQLSLVERVSTAFLRAYLSSPAIVPQPLSASLGSAAALSALTAEP
jgi:hypothetical protein